MKRPLTIFFVNKLYTPMFDHPTKIRDGVETIVKLGIPKLLSEGHVLYMSHAGPIAPYWADYHPNLRFVKIIDKPVDDYINELPEGHTEDQLQCAKVEARNANIRGGRITLQEVRRIKPDVIFNHVTSVQIAKLAHEFPIVNMSHLCLKDFFAIDGLLKNMKRIVDTGGVNYCSPFCHWLSMEYVDSMRGRHKETPVLEKAVEASLYFNRLSVAYTPLEDRFYNSEILPSTGKVIQIGRIADADPKRFVRIGRLGLPIEAWCVKAKGGNSVLANLQKLSNVDLRFNQPRELLLESIRTSSAAIMAWPEEVSGIAAIEAMMVGAIPIMFAKDAGRTHGSEHYIRAAGIKYPSVISFNQETHLVKADLERAIAFTNSIPFETRVENAMKARKTYSIEAWYSELMSLFDQAIREHRRPRNMVMELDLT